jgi:hypothetical protein
MGFRHHFRPFFPVPPVENLSSRTGVRRPIHGGFFRWRSPSPSASSILFALGVTRTARTARRVPFGRRLGSSFSGLCRVFVRVDSYGVHLGLGNSYSRGIVIPNESPHSSIGTLHSCSCAMVCFLLAAASPGRSFSGFAGCLRTPVNDCLHDRFRHGQ